MSFLTITTRPSKNTADMPHAELRRSTSSPNLGRWAMSRKNHLPTSSDQRLHAPQTPNTACGWPQESSTNRTSQKLLKTYCQKMPKAVPKKVPNWGFHSWSPLRTKAGSVCAGKGQVLTPCPGPRGPVLNVGNRPPIDPTETIRFFRHTSNIFKS